MVEPILGQFRTAVVAILAFKNTQLEHLLRRETGLELKREAGARRYEMA